MALAALHCRRTNPRSILTGWSCCAFTVATAVATLALGAFSASYIAHDLLEHIPQLQSMNSHLDDIVSALPADLRLIVRRNGSVDINRALPFGLTVTLGTWRRRIAFDDASLTPAALKKRYGLASVETSMDVILAGSRLLALDTSAMTPAQNQSYHQGVAVPLTYHSFDLGRERSVELPLSMLCEALSDDELRAAVDAEEQLAIAARGGGRAGEASKSLALARRSDPAAQRIIVASRSHRKSLLYFNSTALQRAAGDVVIPIHRWNSLWMRLNGSAQETAALVRASTLRLIGLGEDSDAEGLTTSTSPVAASTSVGLTSNFVCTRETVATALEGMRSDQFMHVVPWALLLKGASIMVQVVCVAAYVALVTGMGLLTAVTSLPLLLAAHRSGNTRGPIGVWHVWRLCVVTAIPIAWWALYSNRLLEWGVHATRGTGVARFLAQVDESSSIGVLVALHIVSVLALVAYVYDEPEPPAAAVAVPVASPPPASMPPPAPVVTATEQKSDDGARGELRRRHRRRRGDSSDSDTHSSSSRERSSDDGHHHNGRRRRHREREASRAVEVPLATASPAAVAHVLALQQQILTAQMSIQHTLARAYMDSKAAHGVVTPPRPAPADSRAAAAVLTAAIPIPGSDSAAGGR